MRGTSKQTTNPDTDGAADSEADPAPLHRAQAFRDAFLAAVNPDDVRAIAAAVVDRAKAGDHQAMKLLLDRTVGVTPVADWPSRAKVEQAARLEEMLSAFGS